METEFFVSEAGVSGLLADPEIGIQVFVSDDAFEITVLAPELSRGAVEFKPIQSVEFARGNEKEALAACSASERESLERKYSEAINLRSEWDGPYVDAGANYTGTLYLDNWASRYSKYKTGVQLLLDAVDSNSPRGLHPEIDAELESLLREGNSKIEAIQEFVDYNYRYLYGGYSRSTWDDLMYAADPYGPGTPSFNSAVIRTATSETCETRVQ